MGIRPLGQKIMIQEQKVEVKKPETLIIIPDEFKEKNNIAVVVKISTMIEDCPVKVGDSVLYDKYAGTKFKHDEKEYTMLEVTDLIGVID